MPGGICEPSGSDPGQYEGTLPHTGRSPQASHSFCPGSGRELLSIQKEENIIDSRRNTTPMVTK